MSEKITSSANVGQRLVDAADYASKAFQEFAVAYRARDPRVLFLKHILEFKERQARRLRGEESR